jgi:DNA-binding transcriptional LysR family regulator
MVCSNLDALINLAQAGRGITCVPDFAVKDSSADGRPAHLPFVAALLLAIQDIGKL